MLEVTATVYVTLTCTIVVSLGEAKIPSTWCTIVPSGVSTKSELAKVTMICATVAL